MQETIRQQKQNYLRTHIIDKQYDADSFSDFISNQKPGGSHSVTRRRH